MSNCAEIHPMLTAKKPTAEKQNRRAGGAVTASSKSSSSKSSSKSQNRDARLKHKAVEMLKENSIWTDVQHPNWCTCCTEMFAHIGSCLATDTGPLQSLNVKAVPIIDEFPVVFLVISVAKLLWCMTWPWGVNGRCAAAPSDPIDEWTLYAVASC